MSLPRSNVPCGSCSLCCRADVIMLMPEEGDDVASYEHNITTLAGTSRAVVKKGDDGNCIYLKSGRCSIWDRAPAICRVFDCRGWYLSKTRPERRRLVKQGIADQAVFDAGRERLPSLEGAA